MTPITGLAAVNDDEQWPLLQDILEAAVDDTEKDPLKQISLFSVYLLRFIENVNLL